MGAGGRNDRLINIVLDEKTFVRRKPEVEHERAIAIYDLLEENHFRLLGEFAGPYILKISLIDNRLRLDIESEGGYPLAEAFVAMAPFRGIVKDYFIMCESYYSAVKMLTPAQIEAIDMGRRGLHNEGSRMLADYLADKIEIDFVTARRLFTLVCVLHIRG